MKKLFTLFIFLCAALSSSADTWYLSGSEGLTGYGWGIHDENILTETSTGTYTITKENVSAGSYEFKITNSGWATSYPANNYVLNLSENSDVIISFTANDGSIDVKISPIWIVAGCLWKDNTENDAPGFVGTKWAPSNTDNRMEETSSGSGWWKKTYSPVPAGTYWFKVVNGYNWTDAAAYPSNNNYVLTLPNDDSTVDIYFDVANTAVKTYVHGVWSVAGSSAALNGSTDWEATTANDMTNTDGTVWTLDVSEKYLVKGTTYVFKVINNHAWDFAYPSSNQTFTVDVSGYYKITYSFDTNDNSVSVSTERITTYDKYIYVRKDENTKTAPYCYVWDYNGETKVSTDLNGNWPGTQIPETSTATINGVTVTYWKAGPFVSSVAIGDGIGYIISQGNSEHQTSGDTGHWLSSLSDYIIYRPSEATQEGRKVFIPRLWGIPDWNNGTPMIQDEENENLFVLPNQTFPAWDEFGIKFGETYYAYSKGGDRKEIASYSDAEQSLVQGADKSFVFPNTTTCTMYVNTSTMKVNFVSSLGLPYFTVSGSGPSYTYNANAKTYTMTATSDWQTIHCPTSFGSVKDDFLIIKKKSGNETVDLYVEVHYRDGSTVNKTFGANATNCIMAIDNSKIISDVELKNVKAGKIVFEDLYLASAVARAELKTAAGGYATFSSNEDVAIPEGITAKYPSEVTSAGAITWVPFANGIPANQGALLEGTAGTTYKFPPAVESPSTVPDEAKTTVTMEPIATKDLLQQENNGYTKYILSKQSPDTDVVGFFKVNYSSGSWVNAGTAYLKVNNNAFLGAPAFFPLTGETTAIDNLTTEPAAKGEEKIYSLDGRRIVGQPTAKGIYIVNGKKLLKK